MSNPPATPDELDALEQTIDSWLATELETNPILVDVTRADDVPRRWYVRLVGEEKDFTTIWLTLGQRTLKYETYVLPFPEENHREVYELLLRQNYRLVGAQFGIGPEDGLFLSGELPTQAVDSEELDRIVGSIYAYVERFFGSVVRLAFASRF